MLPLINVGCRQLKAIDLWIENNSTILNLIFFALGIFFVVYFFCFWVFHPAWVHTEFPERSLLYLLKSGEDLFSNCIQYVFNQNLGESGFYRPRALSFFIQYLDTNLAFRLYQEANLIGIKLPSYAFSIGATVAAYVWFWKSLDPNNQWGIGLLGGASLLYYDIYINTSFMVLRGGKFLATASCLVCLSLFLRMISQTTTRDTFIKSTAIAIVLFILATIDEQVTAIVFLLSATAFFISKKEKKFNLAAGTFGIANILFFSYYFIWGKILFEHFTPGGLQTKSHPHQLYHAFRLSFDNLFHAIEILFANYVVVGFSGLIFVLVFVFSIIKYFSSKKCTIQDSSILITLILFPILITLAMIASHPPIYRIKSLWFIFYLHAPVALLFCVVPYAISIARFKTQLIQMFFALALIIICASGVYKLQPRYDFACSDNNTLKVNSYCGDVSIFQGD
ncbi:hypothetical protein [Pseudodesulfovibrio nedwellii]|uniref:hypothetical protein n=1 Tax=Pseudodesulfovibrio nedwellii TaxID=2973072 RepID=UPI002490412B|nr:hypothetical protein [Pseudodesulfovibrio nedwellii]